MVKKVPVKSVEPNIADMVNGWLKSYKLDYKLEQEELNTEIDKALNDYFSKNGGSGGNRPDAKLLLRDKTLSYWPKRVDAVMKTKGIISNICFVEIKTHLSDLLEPTPYRSGCFAPSKELAGAVSQVQGSVFEAVCNLREKISATDSYGNPTGEVVYNYQPKSYLVIGSLEQFVGEHGINEKKLRSFELFRKNTSSPEIITFDELYERAKFIVEYSESKK